MTQASLGDATHRTSPTPSAGPAQPLIASQTLTTDLNGAKSGVYSVADARRIALWVKYSGNAAGGYAHIVPLVSAEGEEPAIADDSWFGLGIVEASATGTLLTGTMPTGADYTIAPEWGVVKSLPTVIRTEEADGASDEVRMCVVLDVTHARWLYVAAEEASGSTAGDIAIDWSISL